MRLEDGELLDPIVDLYPDEAEAYSRWFGKWSVGDVNLIGAECLLNTERKKMLSPEELLLWDLSQPSSGSYFAVGFQVGTGELVKEEFGDWDRNPRVGFATKVIVKVCSRMLDWGSRRISEDLRPRNWVNFRKPG